MNELTTYLVFISFVFGGMSGTTILLAGQDEIGRRLGAIWVLLGAILFMLFAILSVLLKIAK